MKLHSELTARSILRRQPRTDHDGFIHPVLTHLGSPSPLDGPTGRTAVIGRVLELLMTEQTHSAHARPRQAKRHRSRREVAIGAHSGWKGR